MEYWKFVDGEGNILSVESHSYPHKVPGAIQITKEEYDEYIASLPEPPPLPEPRDFGAEIDEMKGKMIVSEPIGDEVKITNLVYDPVAREIHHKGVL